MNDRHTLDGLMHCLHNHGLDDFMYRACVVETERHINVALDRVRYIGLQYNPEGEEKIMVELRAIRQSLNRLYRCIEENKTHERTFNRARHVSTERNHCERRCFHELGEQVRGLEQTVIRDMKVNMMTISTRDVANSLKLTEASHQQTRSMAVLTWLMMFYAPLSFAAAIFGMNLKQLNGDGSILSISNFLVVASALLTATICFAVALAMVSRVARKRDCSTMQLLWPSKALSRARWSCYHGYLNCKAAIWKVWAALWWWDRSKPDNAPSPKLEPKQAV